MKGTEKSREKLIRKRENGFTEYKKAVKVNYIKASSKTLTNSKKTKTSRSELLYVNNYSRREKK